MSLFRRIWGGIRNVFSGGGAQAGVETNAAEVAIAVRELGPAMHAALHRGMRKALNRLERHAAINLSGAGAPWSYPVPVRSGNLRRSLRREQRSAVEGYVIAGASYAWAIHEGEMEVGGAMRSYTRRPFMDDASDAVDVHAIFDAEFAGVLQ